MKAISPQAFSRRMRKLQDDLECDKENRHFEMDGIMCDLLRSLGYDKGVDVFHKTTKWYA